MERLRKKLSNKTDRPVFEIMAQNSEKKIRCLFDTGADIPVFTLGKEMLMLYFPDAVLLDNFYAEISGFGKGGEMAEIYKIPRFKIQSDSDEDCIEYCNFFIACIEKESIKYPLILSATMFKRMNYYVDNLKEGNKELTIYHTRELYGTGINSVGNNGARNVIKYNLYSVNEQIKENI